jgi:hypothetical protein
MNEPKKEFFQKRGLKAKDFKKWGKLGGRPKKYVSGTERQKAYRRRKVLRRIESGEVKGILNWTTGRVNKGRGEKVIKRSS